MGTAGVLFGKLLLVDAGRIDARASGIQTLRCFFLSIQLQHLQYISIITGWSYAHLGPALTAPVSRCWLSARILCEIRIRVEMTERRGFSGTAVHGVPTFGDEPIRTGVVQIAHNDQIPRGGDIVADGQSSTIGNGIVTARSRFADQTTDEYADQSRHRASKQRLRKGISGTGFVGWQPGTTRCRNLTPVPEAV